MRAKRAVQYKRILKFQIKQCNVTAKISIYLDLYKFIIVISIKYNVLKDQQFTVRDLGHLAAHS